MRWRHVLLALLWCAMPAAAQEPYTYVKMPLDIPWALYFMFLAFVLIPFVVIIVVAWRGANRDDPADERQGR